MATDDFSAGLEPQLTALRSALHEVSLLFGQLETSVKGGMRAATGATRSGMGEMAREIGIFSDRIQKDFSLALRNAIKGGSDFASVFDKMRTSLEDLVIQLGVVNPAMNVLFGGERTTLAALGSTTGGSFKGNTGIFGSLLGGIFDLFEGRATGGPVRAGVPYIVGERGPELFVPQAAGRIATNPGSAPISITMNISTSDAASFRASEAQIGAMVLDSVRRAQRIR